MVFWQRLVPKEEPRVDRAMRISLNRKPIREPYGGGNQALVLLEEYLRARGHTVRYDLWENADLVFLFDPRAGPEITFSPNEIEDFKARHPDVPVLHRINECDQRKGTGNVDALLASANRLADCTVFVSAWLRDYFVARWFEAQRRHAVILNGADPRIFKPAGKPPPPPDDLCRIVTHHWSNNWRKGFKVYAEVDEAVATGLLPGFSLTVIGRWPDELKWKATQTYPPARGRTLARLLGRHHLYLTASLWDPGPMHTAEGAQCGLPIVFHEDGGGIVEFASRVGIGFRDDVVGALKDARRRYFDLRQRVEALDWSGVAMCREYETTMQHLIETHSNEPAMRKPRNVP